MFSYAPCFPKNEFRSISYLFTSDPAFGKRRKDSQPLEVTPQRMMHACLGVRTHNHNAQPWIVSRFQ